MFAVPLEEVVELHSSSGTTGKPVVVGYTEHDMAVWAECIARLVQMAGVVPATVRKWRSDTACSPAASDCTTDLKPDAR